MRPAFLSLPCDYLALTANLFFVQLFLHLHKFDLPGTIKQDSQLLAVLTLDILCYIWAHNQPRKCMHLQVQTICSKTHTNHAPIKSFHQPWKASYVDISSSPDFSSSNHGAFPNNSVQWSIAWLSLLQWRDRAGFAPASL